MEAMPSLTHGLADLERDGYTVLPVERLAAKPQAACAGVAEKGSMHYSDLIGFPGTFTKIWRRP
jgi:hypothetical protein